MNLCEPDPLVVYMLAGAVRHCRECSDWLVNSPRWGYRQWT
jgi:hypothetical protein